MSESCEPIRILHVFGKLGLGGAESRTVDLFRNIDRSRVQFDFLVHVEADATGKKCPSSDELMKVREQEYFDNSVKKLGGRIYAIPRFNGKNILDYKKAVDKFFKEHKGEWKAVHGHMTSTAAFYLPIAKKNGVPITIAHARSAGTDPGLKGFVTKVIRKPLQKAKTTDFRFACSGEAGVAVFGQKLMDEGQVKIIPNAIDLERFVYNPEVREKIRTECGVGNAIVIGHVGRFHYAKNHEFLIRVFACIGRLLDNDDNNEYSIIHGMRVRLMLLGEGSLMESTRELARELKVEDKIMFMGNKSNANEYYQAMDYFCFPSRYEGLPGTVVEAQAAGIQCLISDTITTDVDATELVSRMSIEDDPMNWAKKILNDLLLRDADHMTAFSAGNRAESSEYIIDKIKKAGFDVKAQARMLASFYEKGRF